MKRYLILTLFSCMCVFGHTQTQILGEENTSMLREADAVWSRRVWRIIDLRERANQLFYAPQKTSGDKMNLLAIMLQSVSQGKIAAYDPLYDDFKIKLTLSEIKAAWTEKRLRTFEKPYPPYEQYDSVVYKQFDLSTVKKIRLKEEWYYDKDKGFMEVKILGFCPMKENFDDQTGLYLGFTDMFWIYFPEFKLVLEKQDLVKEIIVEKIRMKTFADIFSQRFFSSFIYKEDNVFNRRVDDYSRYGLDNLIEADRIKESIRESEDALWGE